MNPLIAVTAEETGIYSCIRDLGSFVFLHRAFCLTHDEAARLGHQHNVRVTSTDA
jgi:hypothetical protein